MLVLEAATVGPDCGVDAWVSRAATLPSPSDPSLARAPRFARTLRENRGRADFDRRRPRAGARRGAPAAAGGRATRACARARAGRGRRGRRGPAAVRLLGDG